MRIIMKSLGYGILLWLSVFILSVLIYPVKTSDPLFFETLISIILVSITIIVSLFKLRNAILVGLVWMALNLAIDFPLFSYGPMKKSFTDYITDIGLTYLIIPIITTGIAFAVNRSKKFST